MGVVGYGSIGREVARLAAAPASAADLQRSFESRGLTATPFEGGSIELLRRCKDAGLRTKTGIMVGIGETVGMQVPGTCTSVWWETLQDGALYFGIPEVGQIDIHGDMSENKHLDPDHEVSLNWPVGDRSDEAARIYTWVRTLDLLNKRIITKLGKGMIPTAEASVMKLALARLISRGSDLALRALGLI